MTRFPALVVASKNPDKLAEVEAILAETRVVDTLATGLDWPDVDETGSTLAENALLKALAVATATGIPALSDDTGLEVAALDGAPGVHTARYAGPDATYADNVDLLLENLTGRRDRRARFVTAVALADPSTERIWIAHGAIEGEISTTSRGSGGFGYDPVFEVDGQTLAEMGRDRKDAISHRAKAIAALIDML